MNSKPDLSMTHQNFMISEFWLLRVYSRIESDINRSTLSHPKPHCLSLRSTSCTIFLGLTLRKTSVVEISKYRNRNNIRLDKMIDWSLESTSLPPLTSLHSWSRGSTNPTPPRKLQECLSVKCLVTGVGLSNHWNWPNERGCGREFFIL